VCMSLLIAGPCLRLRFVQVEAARSRSPDLSGVRAGSRLLLLRLRYHSITCFSSSAKNSVLRSG